MAEHRFFDPGTTPFVATEAFHALRSRARHLEDPQHQSRLTRTAELIRSLEPKSIVDLGCGDGGLLSLLRDYDAWGYDFQPSNEPAWRERGVKAELRDVFNARDVPHWGELVVITEVLEHVATPHNTVAWISRHTRYVVASSPHGETPEQHAEEHAWGWGVEDYKAMFEPHFETLHHEVIDWAQIYVGQNRRAIA